MGGGAPRERGRLARMLSVTCRSVSLRCGTRPPRWREMRTRIISSRPPAPEGYDRFCGPSGWEFPYGVERSRRRQYLNCPTANENALRV